ncbi:SCY1-like protein 2 isoform X2 [Toxorhynchites rutilus septentrionalis]|uniref:SCY1-like protein 2 isoform X2 n=1 Tax=Toxorhynchites rutilus septentrionalis TaxID=329112 RepID=UPI002478D774|nr:SCY1-like protein 2 isoform X2 [Toxorhynchites rutilus septentrionalis]
MDVINKFYSSVTQTVSSVLPGNPVMREYDVTDHIASAGRSCMWKIYSGFKKSTRQEASIFVLDKKQFEKFSKEDKEEMFNIVRSGIIHLTKIRHPQVLTVQYPLEESRESFAFASEPVYASLANILGDTTNVPPSATKQLIRHNLHEVEIKYGLLHLFQGIQFIHKTAKLVHRNINPYSVVLNSNGVWKIFGFDYSQDNQEILRYDINPHQSILTYPCLEYTAPECVLNNQVSISADYYSLDMGMPTFKAFLMTMRELENTVLLEVPAEIRESVKSLLTANPSLRQDVIQFSKSIYFDDICVKSLSFLETLFQRDNQEKAKFFRAFTRIIDQLPHHVNLLMVLPCLFKEFVNPTMIPFVLPNVFLIAKICTQAEFDKFVFMQLKPIMTIQEPIQILLIFMQNMELLLKLTPTSDVTLHVLPLVYNALESNSKQIQELCLAIIPSFAKLVNHTTMQNCVLTRIKKLCADTSHNSVRVNCLLCIGQLLPYLDKWTVLDDILSFLPTITAREPAVIMAIIGIYKIASHHELLGIPKEFCANKVLPFLWPLSIQNGLTLQQYGSIVTFMNELSKKVEVEHMNKLQQLHIKDDSVQLGIMPPAAIESPIDDAKNDTKEFRNSILVKNIDGCIFPKNKVNNNEDKSSRMNTISTTVISTNSQVLTTTIPFSLTYPRQISSVWSQQNDNIETTSCMRRRNDIMEPLTSFPINDDFQNNSPNTIPLLKPVSISTQYRSIKSDTILSKEEILEFLK